MKVNYKLASWLLGVFLLAGFSASAQYCTPIYSTGCTSGDVIYNFSTTGGITNVSNLASGCSAGAYQYYTAGAITAKKGASFNFSIQADPNSFGQGHRIWVDWNNDGDFMDSGEDVWNSGSSGTTAYTGMITIPTTANTGKLRLRARCSYAGLPTDPCASQTWGEVEDYDLVVSASLPDDATVVSIDSPFVFCGGAHNIVATIGNTGSNKITSVVVNWKYGPVTQTPVMINTTLDTVGGTGINTLQVVLGNKAFAAGVKTALEVWTTLPNGKLDSDLSNDSIKTEKQPSLSGNFTINPSGTGANNYTNFTDAISDLNQFGVCGPVTYAVSPGTYNEQLDFGAIAGASSTNTIKFNADTTGGGVIVEYGATGTTNNFVIQFNGTKYVTVNSMTFKNSSGGSTAYRRIFYLQGGASYNTMMNCHLIGYGTTSSSANYSVFYCSGAGHNYNKFMNNKIDANGQYYGLYFFGGSTSATNIGNEFIGNDLNGAYYMGAYIYYHTGTKFNYNKINSSNYTTSGTSYGVYSYYGYEDVEFVGNQVHFGYYGMNLNYFEGSPTKGALVANNWVTAGQGTYYTYGMYMYGFQFAKVVNNTVWIRPLSTYGYYGMYFSQGTGNMIVNNLVYAPSMSPTYYGMYVAATSIASEIDYNNVFTNAYYGYYNGVQNTLTAWKNAGAGDHSYDYDPAFVTADSLRHCNDKLDNTGKPLEFLMYDIDMDLRSVTTPDIGADEFVGSDSSSYSAGPDGELCNGAPVKIGAPITGSTYQWSTGAFTPQIEVSTPGDYTVILTSSCGGTFTDVVSVNDITPTAAFSVNDSYQSGKFTNTSKGPGATYRWVVKVNGMNDTAWTKDLQYIFPDNGPYEVCLTTYNKCDTVETCQMWQGAVGIADTELDRNINMFPNPASNNVTIQFNDLKGDNLSIELINIQGQVVYTNNLVDIKGSGTETIDVSSLNGGMYMVRFITSSDIATKQLIVE